MLLVVVKTRTFQTKETEKPAVSYRWEGRLGPSVTDLDAKIRKLDFILKEKRCWAIFIIWEKWSESGSCIIVFSRK